MSNSIIFGLFNLTLVLFLGVLFKKLFNPTNIIIIWWTLWLIVSFAGKTGLDRPNEYLYILVGLFNFSLFCGTVVAIVISSKKKIIYNVNFIEIKLKKFFFLSYKIIFTTVLILFIKSLYLLYSQGIEGFRSLTFSNEENEGILFGNPYLEILYSLIVSPYILFYLFFGIYFYVFKGQKKVFMLSSVLVILDSSMRFGRFGFYYIIIMLIIALSLSSSVSNNLKRTFRNIIIFFISLLILVGSLREGNLFDSIYKSIFQYHTVGFTLFSKEYENPDSKLNRNVSYGMGTLGGLDYISTLFIRRINSTYESQYSLIVKDHHLPVKTGEDEFGFPIYHNAFYTMLFTLYSDGREIFIFMVPFLLSLILIINYLKFLNSNSLISLLYILLIMFVFIFSIFQSMLQSHIVFLAFIAIILVSFFEKKHIENV